MQNAETIDLVNPRVFGLDGQHIKAQKYGFDYNDELENQRRFIALFVDFLAYKESILIKQNEGDLEAAKFPPAFSDLDTALGVFVISLYEIGSITVLIKEPSFNQHLNSLNCFNLDFYLRTKYPGASQAKPKTSNKRHWHIMKARTSLDVLQDLQSVSQLAFANNDNLKCDLWNFFEQELESMNSIS
jgi:hypothetical protein